MPEWPHSTDDGVAMRSRRRLVIVAALVLVGCGVIATVAVWPSPRPHASAAAVTAYEKAIVAPLPMADRRAVITAGVDAAQHGDQLFDRASALLQKARKDAGLPPSTNFPA
jgi:hypothetical protein